jgi:TfoX/Sxy family transcriptional regulator of competence genes
MAYSEVLADRAREVISQTEENVEEKRMFGGLCFMVEDKMLAGVMKDRLMLRLNPDKFDEVIEQDGCTPMDFTGKKMRGFVYVDMEVLDTREKMEYWINLALDYNKIAKPTKRKKS